MQIGGLGYINTVVSTEKGTSESQSTSGFAGLFGALMTQNTKGTDKQVEPALVDGLSKEEVQELINFLKTEDVLDLEGGLELLDKIMSSSLVDLVSVIKEYLGGMEEGSLLDNSIDDVSLVAEGRTEGSLEKLVGLEEQLMVLMQNKLPVTSENQGESTLEKLVNSEEQLLNLTKTLNQILPLPANEFVKVVNKDFTEISKVIKLYDLLAKNQDSKGNNVELKGLIEQITKKLESLLQFDKVLLDNGKQVKQKLEMILAGNQARTGLNNGASEKATYTSRLDLQAKFSTVAMELRKNSLIPVNNEEKSDLQSSLPKLEIVNGNLQLQQISRPEQLTIMLDKSGKPTNVEDMVRQFENILSKSQFSKLGGTQKLLIKLNPEHLGNLRIELIQKDSMMIAKILTSTVTAKDVIESQLNSLKQAFSSQNIQVERIEISQQMNQQERSLNKDGQQQHEQSKQQSQERKEEQQNEKAFDLSFEEALLNTEI